MKTKAKTKKRIYIHVVCVIGAAAALWYQKRGNVVFGDIRQNASFLLYLILAKYAKKAGGLHLLFFV